MAVDIRIIIESRVYVVPVRAAVLTPPKYGGRELLL